MKYPMKALCIELAFHPFAWGTLYQFHNFHRSEFQKSQAETMWFLRLGCFTLSQRRML